MDISGPFYTVYIFSLLFCFPFLNSENSDFQPLQPLFTFPLPYNTWDNLRIVTTPMTISLQSNAQSFLFSFVSDGGMLGYLSLRCTVEGLSIWYMVRFISVCTQFSGFFTIFFKTLFILFSGSGSSFLLLSPSCSKQGYSGDRGFLYYCGFSCLQSMGSGVHGASVGAACGQLHVC